MILRFISLEMTPTAVHIGADLSMMFTRNNLHQALIYAPGWAKGR